MIYRRVDVVRRGGPENLRIVEHELLPPEEGKVRVRVLAVPVCAPDITARYGRSPLIPKPPFTPGYAVVGEVDAVGRGVTKTAVGDRVAALIGYGGYAEYVYLAEGRLISIPAGVQPVQTAPLIMNYLVAFQALHRLAHVTRGQKVLIIGASGGIGTAFLQLGKLAGLAMFGVASRSKHSVLAEYGAVPIDYRSEDFVAVIRSREPQGLDAVFDGMAGDSFRRGYSVLKRGGILVGYGNPQSAGGLFEVFGRMLLYSLLPDGKSVTYYSTGKSYLNRKPFLEDWAALFRLLEEKKIQPLIAAEFPILRAAEANALLESGTVVGNVVLKATDE
ncbi:MAG: zinc-binding dehydrogenase [Anaerolineales bacterium]|nr:zinc-binding dehydrogenase [Anaerolineales bacterium]